MQHVPRGCCEQFPTEASTKPLLVLAVLLGHSTGPPPGLRSTHKVLGSLPFSAKPMAPVAHRGGPARQTHPLRTECRKKMLFLSSVRAAQILEGHRQSSPSLHFGGSYTLEQGQETPPFQLELLPGILPNTWHLYAIFVLTCCPKEKNFYLPAKRRKAFREATNEKALLNALRTRSIV